MKYLDCFEKIYGKSRHILLNKSYYLKNKKNKAIFLDRDGVLIKDCHYIKNPDEVELEFGAKEFLLKAKKLNWKIIVVTNQSGISRGYFDWDQYEVITERILTLIEDPQLIDGIFANGFKDCQENDCWRKPCPGMIKNAVSKLEIDIKKSFLIGDRLTDLEAAARAELRFCIHLKTGNGAKEFLSIKRYIKKTKNFGNKIVFKENNNMFECNILLADNFTQIDSNEVLIDDCK